MVQEGFKEKLTTLGLLASIALSSPLMGKNAESLYSQLSRHEGVHRTVYKDSRGIPTVGIGFNLQDANNKRILAKYGITNEQLKKGLSDTQIKQLFEESLKQAKSDAIKFLPDLNRHPINVQNAVIDMSFNLGLTRLNTFIDFKQSLRNRNYKKAADDMLDSLWAKQTGRRAIYLANLVRSS